MAGLLSKGSSGQQQSTAQTEAPNVSPEEQKQYDDFVGNGMSMLYAENGLPQIIEALKGDGDPVEGLANALVMLVMRLEDSAAEAGEEISGDVMYHGSVELLEQMIEIAEEAGIHEFSAQDQENALYLALDQYRITRQQQGKLPEETLRADMQQLVDAEQSGNLEEMLPGIGNMTAANQAPGGA